MWLVFLNPVCDACSILFLSLCSSRNCIRFVGLSWSIRIVSTIWRIVSRFKTTLVKPVAGLFLTRLGQRILKTQQVLKIKERFQVMLKLFKYSRVKSSTLLGSKPPRNFPKSRYFLGGLSGGFNFHGSFSKRTVQIWSTISNRGGFNEQR